MAILLKMGRNVVSRALAGGSAAAAAHPTPLAARHPSCRLGVSFFSDGPSPPPRPGGLFREVDGFVGGGFGLGFNLGFVRFNRIPRKTKFAKQFKGTMKGIAHRGNEVCFGTYALQALEPAWITSQQIEAGRRAMSRVAGRGSKIWIRVIPDKPITRKPAETRMGRGKGSVAFWVAVVQPGRILYEMAGVTESVAKKAITIAASKMPIGTRMKKC